MTQEISTEKLVEEIKSIKKDLDNLKAHMSDIDALLAEEMKRTMSVSEITLRKDWDNEADECWNKY